MSDADKLIQESKEEDDEVGKQSQLSVIPESPKDQKASNGDSDISQWDQRYENKQKLLNELKPLLNVNSKLRLYRAIK